MDEWTSTNDYDTRVANLSATLTDSVSDDDSKDVLTGSAGIDWFFANLEGTGVLDKITDLSADGSPRTSTSSIWRCDRHSHQRLRHRHPGRRTGGGPGRGAGGITDAAFSIALRMDPTMAGPGRRLDAGKRCCTAQG